ncbi:NapC/NirT family cytochrome c [Geobacter sp. DSM 9736]|uniref:cytochrome c3 family protein n=1 Tax=Geobacter sp. DSM 9736 TaxID=1277350 RepID=UPI000B507F4F|nr:NapC/NirT family cytochrome c [Geobacter sp. DSM 9736]SNB44740.1 NapC/NirT cytochrome c family, N-terminal region [Geobacter sp. DSM 9736]
MKLPHSAKNWLSLSGAIIAVTSLFMIIFLFLVTVVMRAQAPYLGLIIYILLPSVMVAGLLLIPIGMVRTVHKERQDKVHVAPGWPRIDLEDPRHRNAAFIFIIGTGFFLLVSAVGSYEAFHYTESVAFCGTLCHTVMEPEHVAHSKSPHARVSCVACHVGPGADWYVRSKLSGLYQVYAVLAGVYPRPIPTPIHNLRPARAVCEQCHWPESFSGHKQLQRTYYLPDRDNTPWVIGLGLKTGPAQEALGLIEGIHWHINPHVRIEYVATDKDRQQIPWVRSTNLETGKVKIFRDAAHKADDAVPKEGALRTMDCIDCHNRPSHRYRAPAQFVNHALAARVISPDLPEIKRVAVEACSADDATADKVRSSITSFYGTSYPEIATSARAQVEQAARAAAREFSSNIFPYMKARWSAYPDNIGHLYFPGCFRCHNGTHQTAEGEKISRDCTLCHDITVQGIAGKEMATARTGESLPFRHPQEVGTSWEETACHECHTGAVP